MTDNTDTQRTSKDLASLMARVDDLEMRLTYQDQIIEDLNTTIVQQWKQIDVLMRKLSGLVEQLDGAGPQPFSALTEPPPPHY